MIHFPQLMSHARAGLTAQMDSGGKSSRNNRNWLPQMHQMLQFDTLKSRGITRHTSLGQNVVLV